MRTRLRVILIDTSVSKTGRIVDYVNLDSTEPPLDLTASLMQDVPGQTGLCGNYYTPNGSDGSMWCTNHLSSLADQTMPTYGILNQLSASLALPNVNADWSHALQEFPAGLN